MNADFPNISILGSGLLGGSLALALAAQGQAPRVRLWARKAQTAADARARGDDAAADAQGDDDHRQGQDVRQQPLVEVCAESDDERRESCPEDDQGERIAREPERE